MANSNDHATKADLKVLREELKGDMAALRHELKADNVALREEIREVIHDTETKLLRAFYGFAEATQKRMTIMENTTGGLTNLMATLDRRITDLEKRVNFPDAP